MKTLQILGNSTYGGGTYLVIKWCEYLLAKGWQVEVLSTDHLTIQRLKRLEGIIVIDHIFIPRDIKLIRHLKAFFQLFLFLINRKYDVVHTYSATPSVLGRFAGKLAKIGKIFHHQAGWTTVETDNFLTKRFYKIIENLAALSSTLSICVSHSVYKQGLSENLAPKRKLTIICNGIDPSPFFIKKTDSLKAQFDLPIEAFIIGSTGRLALQKDLETLIRSFNLLLLRKPKKEIYLFLAGSGDHENNLIKIVKTLNLQSKIIFLGFYEDIPNFLANVDIVVSSSLREGLSISVMEAMAAAKPIVVSSIAPNIELIDNGVNGLTFPPGDHIALAEALAELIENKEDWKKYGEAAREKLINEYSIDRMFSETYALYLPEKR